MSLRGLAAMQRAGYRILRCWRATYVGTIIAEFAGGTLRLIFYLLPLARKRRSRSQRAGEGGRGAKTMAMK